MCILNIGYSGKEVNLIQNADVHPIQHAFNDKNGRWPHYGAMYTLGGKPVPCRARLLVRFKSEIAGAHVYRMSRHASRRHLKLQRYRPVPSRDCCGKSLMRTSGTFVLVPLPYDQPRANNTLAAKDAS
jgi:hypothetical protein